VKGLVLTGVVLSLLVLAAHFLRAANLALLLVSLAMIALVGVRRTWSRRALQVVLTLGFLEWMRVLMVTTNRRLAAGEPWERLAMILGAVAVVTALSVFGLEVRRLRLHFDAADTPDDARANEARRS